MRSTSPFPASSLIRKLNGNGQSLCPVAGADQADADEVGDLDVSPEAASAKITLKPDRPQRLVYDAHHWPKN